MNLLELFLPTLIRRSVRQVIVLCRSLFGVSALVLLMPPVNATGNEATPSLFIPLGSYLEHFNIGLIHFNQGDMYLNFRPYGDFEDKLSFEVADGIPNPESCWSQGYDLAKGRCTDLSCDTTTQRTPDEVSRFLYSAPMPYGSYLAKCTGIIRTLENNRYFLYATCLKAGHGPNPRDNFYQKNKLDITDCQNDINSDELGALSCTDSPVRPKQILSGSFLSSCNLSDTYYYPDHDLRYIESVRRFDQKSLSLLFANSCIGSGKDITFSFNSPSPLPEETSLSEGVSCPDDDTSSTRYKPPSSKYTARGSLICKEDSTKEVRPHTASRYIPAGNYLLTCKKIAFYPCMGPDRQGVLSAQCRNAQGIYQETQLAYGDSECRMSKPGYVSNINGQLHCDPDSPFDNEDTTQGADLLPHFQCNEDEGASPVPTVTPLNSTAND